MKTVGQSPTPGNESVLSIICYVVMLGGGSRPSSRPSSRMTPDSQNPPVC